MTPPNPQVSSTCSNWVGSFILVRAWGLEPQRIAAREPKGYVTLVKDFQSPPHHKGGHRFQRFKRDSVVTGRTPAKS